MPAIRGGAIGAPFLTSFLQSYDVAQELARREREGRARDVLQATQMGEFLRERGLQEEGQGVLADLLAQQGARTIAPPAPIRRAAPLVEPPGGAVEGAVTVPQPGILPPDAGRPPVLQTLTQGLDPLSLARQMGRPAFRQAMAPIEEAERERRKEEDRLQAQEFLKEGKRRLEEDKDYIGWTDMMAAAARRTGHEQFANQMMLYGAAARKDKDLNQEIKQWLGEFVPAVRAMQDLGTGEAHDKFYQVLAKGSPQAWESVGKGILGHWIQGVMTNKAMPPPVARILAEYGRLFFQAQEDKQEPDLVALWGQAIAKYPEDQGRFYIYVLTGGMGLPDTARRYYRLPDFKLDLERLSTAAGRALSAVYTPGFNPSNPKDQARFTERFLAEATAEVKAKETDLQRAQAKLATARAEEIESESKPLEKMSESELSRELQRAQRARKEAETYDPSEVVRMNERVQDIIAMQRKKAGKPPDGQRKGRASEILGGRTYEQLSKEERQAVLLDIGQRLLNRPGLTHEQLLALPESERRRVMDEVRRIEKGVKP